MIDLHETNDVMQMKFYFFQLNFSFNADVGSSSDALKDETVKRLVTNLSMAE